MNKKPEFGCFQQQKQANKSDGEPACGTCAVEMEGDVPSDPKEKLSTRQTEAKENRERDSGAGQEQRDRRDLVSPRPSAGVSDVNMRAGRSL